MSRAEETASQTSFIGDGGPDVEPSEGPVASPPAPSDSSGSSRRRASARAGPPAGKADATQLSLPLDPEPSPHPGHPAQEKKPRKRRRGFVRVTEDPDVARAYSDHADLGNAIAQGLAQALASLPPEELAALRARVAQGARKSERHATSRGASGEPKGSSLGS